MEVDEVISVTGHINNSIMEVNTIYYSIGMDSVELYHLINIVLYIQFSRTSLMYISNKETIDSLLCSYL